jgi:hypothetical protein
VRGGFSGNHSHDFCVDWEGIIRERRLKAYCSLELELVMRMGCVCLESVSGVRFESSGEDEIHGRRGEEGERASPDT